MLFSKLACDRFPRAGEVAQAVLRAIARPHASVATTRSDERAEAKDSDSLGSSCSAAEPDGSSARSEPDPRAAGTYTGAQAHAGMPTASNAPTRGLKLGSSGLSGAHSTRLRHFMTDV